MCIACCFTCGHATSCGAHGDVPVFDASLLSDDMDYREVSSSDVLVQCDNVSKKFCRDLKRSLWYGVQDMIADFMPSHLSVRPRVTGRNAPSRVEDGLRPDEFWAV